MKWLLSCFTMLTVFFGYIVVVQALPPQISYDSCDVGVQGERVGFCTKVSVVVQRDYYFGLVTLPTRVIGISVDWLNRLIGPLSLLLGAALQRVYKP